MMNTSLSSIHLPFEYSSEGAVAGAVDNMPVFTGRAQQSLT